MAIKLGDVHTFKTVEDDKKQALKILEEAAEVYDAWQDYDHYNHKECHKTELLRECADVIQATCNLIKSIGVSDFRAYLEDCKAKNKARGRLYEDLQIPKISIDVSMQMTIDDELSNDDK